MYLMHFVYYKRLFYSLSILIMVSNKYGLPDMKPLFYKKRKVESEGLCLTVSKSTK